MWFDFKKQQFSGPDIILLSLVKNLTIYYFELKIFLKVKLQFYLILLIVLLTKLITADLFFILQVEFSVCLPPSTYFPTDFHR